MKKEKTALRKLIDYMEENYHLTDESRQEFKQAILAEIEQIKLAFNEGYRIGFGDANHVTENDKDISEYDDSENYYKNNYNTKV